ASGAGRRRGGREGARGPAGGAPPGVAERPGAGPVPVRPSPPETRPATTRDPATRRDRRGGGPVGLPPRRSDPNSPPAALPPVMAGRHVRPAQRRSMIVT